MSAVAAAIGVAAVVGAGATVYAGSKAASATRDASRAAISEQQAALQQQAQLSQPYRDLGQSAIPQLQTLLGITPAGQTPTAATRQAQLDALRSTPGYQFQQEQGTLGALNAASAQGMNLSGNTLEALSKFNQGLADTTYQQSVGNLENVVNTGQAAAAGQAANVGNAASNISNALINQGNTQAGIDVNTAAGVTKSIGNAANQWTTYNTLQGLNNPTGVPAASSPTPDYGPPSTGTTTNWGIGDTTNFENPAFNETAYAPVG